MVLDELDEGAYVILILKLLADRVQDLARGWRDGGNHTRRLHTFEWPLEHDLIGARLRPSFL